MNRKIRQLAAGLMVLYVILFAAMNYWQVGPESELNAMGGNTRAIRREFSGREARSSAPTASSSPAPCRHRTAASSPTSGSTTTGELFANVTGYYRWPSEPPSSNARRTRCSPGRRRSSASATSRTSSPAARAPATCADAARRPAGDGRHSLAGGGSVVMVDTDRRRAGDVQQPDVRPEPHRQPGLRRRPRRARGTPRGAGQPAAGQRLPGALYPARRSRC